MKKLTKRVMMMLVFVLGFGNIFSAISNADTIVDKNEAISTSAYYSVKQDEILLNEQEALSKNPYLTNEEINQVKTFLKSLSDKTVDQILTENGYDTDDIKIDSDMAHANIVWYIPVIIGAIIVAGGIIFSAKYFTHKEKMTLINKCYDQGGSPKLDSRDKSGLKGTTSSGEANSAGGYSFECIK